MGSETKTFPTADVLSVVTGRLIGTMKGYCSVLSWMSGESQYTHQLPRVADEATPVILALHPQLSKAVLEAEQVNPDTVATWQQTWIDRYGDEITVPRMNVDQHERIEPISEMAERVHPDRIICISIEDAEDSGNAR